MMNDLISRQAAIDAALGVVDEWEGGWDIEGGIRDAINALPSAQPDLDSAYTEGYTQAEAKYRKMWDEMQANIKEKAFGKRKGLVHTADIDAMPTIEERKTGKWIIEPYDVENDIWVHRCGECMKVTMLGSKKSRFNYCPHCGARLVQEGEEP